MGMRERARERESERMWLHACVYVCGCVLETQMSASRRAGEE